MENESVEKVLEHYRRLYVARLGKPPRRKDLDPVLVRTLIRLCGDAETVIGILDGWFESSDPWYEGNGFSFDRCFAAINRLVGTGEIQPTGPPARRDAVQRFATLLVERRLRLVR
jgi:hypothetical protein